MQLKFFAFIISLYLIRDIVFEFYRFNEIILSSEILILLIYLIWLKTYFRTKRLEYFFISLNILFFIFSILNLIFNFIDNNYKSVIIYKIKN